MDIYISLYFISTFFLILGGIISLLPMFSNLNKQIQKAILSASFQTKLGLFGTVSWIIFCFFPQDGVIIFGDLLPFLAALVLTLLFFMGYVRESKHLDEATIQKADKILTFLQIPSGIAAFIVGILHVLFPQWIIF